MSTQTEHDCYMQKHLAEWMWKHIENDNANDTTTDLLVSHAKDKITTNWNVFKVSDCNPLA